MVLLRRYRRRLAALPPFTRRSVVLHSSQKRLAAPAGPVERRRRVDKPLQSIPLVKGEPPVDAVVPAEGGADMPLQSLHLGASMAIDSCGNADALMVMISSSSSHGCSALVTVFLS
jgi:hypothetical protein